MMFPSAKKPSLAFSWRVVVVPCWPSSLRGVLFNRDTNTPTDELIRFRWSEVKVHSVLLNTELIVWIIQAAGVDGPRRSYRVVYYQFLLR